MVHVVCVGEVLLFSPGQAKPLVTCASPEPHVSLGAHEMGTLEMGQARMG